MGTAYKTKNLPISEIEVNKGQIYGLPKNPRFIRDERFKALKKSIEDAPEMLGLRELLVYPYEGKYVVIGGNMRLKACEELGYKEIPCKVLPEETPVAKLREYTIKDNEGFGQNDWDILANEWEVEELQNWGMENLFPNTEADVDNLFEEAGSVSKSNIEKLTVTIPENLVDKKPDFKAMIEQTLCDYEGIKVV